ncbi:MAG: ABC transporter ATP-binding protein, partial [Planctomycetes bacterium]|nr:ABC transporter ATP-binding protein [Planctomycetota bacterium]
MSESRGDVLAQVSNLVMRFDVGGGLGAALMGGKRSLRAVDDVTLDIRAGEVLGLVGESGSGKTTLGKTLLRLYEPSDGSIVFKGTDITRLGGSRLKDLRRDLQMIFQDPASSLNPRQTVRTAIATPMLIHAMHPADRIDVEVDRILTKVGLSAAFRDRYPHELSGGQLQRVAIGRALSLSPALVVADEAVSKLDVSVRSQILNLFKDLQAELGTTIVFITHDLRVARYLCHRIGVMYFGKLVELADTETLFKTPRHPYTQALLGTLEPTAENATADDEPEEAGEAYNPSAGTPGCRYHARCPF